jgi:hypothetical protein
MPPLLATHTWVSLPNEVRRRIRVVFDISKTGFTEVSDGVILSDGVTQSDFKSLTIEKMQKYLNDESVDFHKLFDKVVAKINDEISGKIPVILSQESISPSSWDVNSIPVAIPKKKERPAKIK